MSERVVITEQVAPTGATKTTRTTTTYSVRSVGGSQCLVGEVGVGEQGTPVHPDGVGSVEGLKKYIEETRNKLLEDPRTKQMIEKGEATWDEVKSYVMEHAPQRQVPSGPTSNHSKFTYSTGYWYPMTTAGTFTAAANTVFEVACGDPEITKKISLRPQVDVVFDAKNNQLVFAFDLPGFVKKDISVEIDNRCISVSGDRPRIDMKDEYGEEMKPLVTERNFGFFCRRFQLPPNALEDSVTALMEDGVLFIRIATTTNKNTKEKKKVNIE